MLRDDVEAALREDHEEDGYLFPAYDDYCFGNVLDTVCSLLVGDGRRPLPRDVLGGDDGEVATVVLVLVDGYGLTAWRRDLDRHPLLAALTEVGTVTPLTSIYPSETAAAVTTLETGQLPVEHGRIGWNVYDPATDRSFLALDGRVVAGDAGAASAPEAREGIDYRYPALADAGVDCHRLRPFPAEGTGVTDHRYDRLDEFGGRLADLAAESDDPAYVYAYLPQVDDAAHEAGTESGRFRAAVRAVCEQLSSFVDRLDRRTAEGTLLLVAADHGHVDTDPARNVDLDRFEDVVANLRRYAEGPPVRLAGSPRNVHLHLREGTVEATREALSALDARTFTRREALERELFGDRPASATFQRRCGDLVLTHRDLGTWFGAVEPDALSLVGMHGGLHPDEMLVPFAAVRPSRLQSA